MVSPKFSAQTPAGPVAVPDLVRDLASGELTPIWQNELGGLTFRDGDRYLKWNPAGDSLDLEGERVRLVWARQWHPVPEVLDLARDDTGQVLVTVALPGEGAVTAGWLARPGEAVRAIGIGLRHLHDDLPVADFPFGSVDWVGDHEVPPIDRLVVNHGDSCAPNTIIAPDGSPAGHVDLGSLGLADRWADLAVATMSLGWNYGPTWEGEFWDAYGIAPDPDRIDFYRQLYNAAP